MRPAVLDASALLNFLLDPRGFPPVGSLVEASHSRNVVPYLCDSEILSGLRRLMLAGVLLPERAREAWTDYADLPLDRFPHLPIAPRALSLWQNMAATDAIYVALAEALTLPLLTSDKRLARVAQEHSGVEVVEV